MRRFAGPDGRDWAIDNFVNGVLVHSETVIDP